MRTTQDKITKVQVNNDRISYRTSGCNKPDGWWTGYVCVDNTNILVEHLMTVARRDGKATTERKLIDRIFQGESLSLYTIGEFQFVVQGL